MIPRTLVPEGARLSAQDVASTRRRPTNLDERTLVPSSLPIVQLDGKSTIPTNLPLDAIATRVVVPRDINVELVQREEQSALPPQPTEMDERISIPVGVVPPEEFQELGPISEELVEPNVISTGEVSFLPPEERDYRGRQERTQTFIITVVYALLLLSLPFSPKFFKPHVPTSSEQELARQQMTVLLPPGALESLRPSAPPAPRQIVRVDPKVINKISPPEPTPAPTPPPTRPEAPKRDLPSAPMPQPNVATQTPPPTPTPSQGDLPQPQTRLENPDMPVPQKGLILPKTSASAGGLIRDAARGSKPSAPTAVGHATGPMLSGASGHGGKGAWGAGITPLTDLQGVDFNDYWRRIYYIVKANWEAVMPPSVSLGEQGVVSLHVKIMRDGSVPDIEPVLLSTSGKEPLDRAAISSIRSSNPFPPLPAEFNGPYVEVVYTYYYNLRPPNQ
jgi:TonB family protein